MPSILPPDSQSPLADHHQCHHPRLAARELITEAMRPIKVAILALLLGGCALKFEPPSEPAWGYTAEDGKRPGKSIYLYSTREACARQLGQCRPTTLVPGDEFWVFSQADWRTNYSGGSRWVGSENRETCRDMRQYIANLRQPTSECVQVRAASAALSPGPAASARSTGPSTTSGGGGN
jgi:hypothetical protein